MKFLKRMFVIALMLGMTLSVAACSNDDNTAENAGKKIDQALDSAKDAVHEATK